MMASYNITKHPHHLSPTSTWQQLHRLSLVEAGASCGQRVALSVSPTPPLTQLQVVTSFEVSHPRYCLSFSH